MCIHLEQKTKHFIFCEYLSDGLIAGELIKVVFLSGIFFSVSISCNDEFRL